MMRRLSVRGFTLIEVMVALAVMAIVTVLAAQSFHTASRTSETILDNMKRLAEIERAFVLLETDLKYAIPKIYKQRFGPPIPPITVSIADDYWLMVMRGSVANPLFQPRSEEVRVGYRYIDKAVWRDTWFNPTETEEEEARPQKILTGVENINVRILAHNATSLAAGPWEQDWPTSRSGTFLPKALEITIELFDMGEVKRLYAILPGKVDYQPEQNPNNGAGGNNNNDTEENQN